jgi:signal transduction histidine kinase
MKISLNEKLILYFLALGLGAIFIISIFSFYSTKKALLSRTFDQLTSLRIVKKHQVEFFFTDRVRDITIFSELEDTKKIASELLQIRQGKGNAIPVRDKERLERAFREYLKKYRALNSYFHTIRFLGPGGLVLEAGFGDNPSVALSSRIHDPGIYSVKPGKGIRIGDELYDPETGKPVMTLSETIEIPGRNHQQVELVLGMPVDAINAIMLNNDPASGLGQTGETYLVGSDWLMRSTSRFQPVSILKTVVKTRAAIAAFDRKEGTVIINDYRNIPVLSSFSLLSVPGLNWAILAEIDLKEAMVPIYRMRNSIIFLSSLIAVVLFLIVFVITRRITRPVTELKNAAIEVGKGQYDIHLPVTTNDEIGALTESFNLMAGQIKEKTNELQLERIGRLRSVFDGEEIERQRLSRELHDGIGQVVIALKLRLESLLYTPGPRLKENLQEVIGMFDNTVDEIRRISNNLTPAVLEAFGITIALRNLCSETAEHAGISVNFEADGELENMHPNIRTYIYRIGQEAINNIMKHSGATEVSIRLTRKENAVYLSIADNGKGFDPVEAERGEGNGLHNMRERVDLLHGSITIDSKIQQGTTIDVRVPVF